MRVAIMQPYFLPYIGYFNLMADVDKFVIYDDIKYTKKGWINRNRYLLNGRDKLFSINLVAASNDLFVKDRIISPDFSREKTLNMLFEAYRKAPYFDDNMSIIEEILRCKDNNLFRFIWNSLRVLDDHLQIGCELCVSSEISDVTALKGEDKVLSLVEKVGGTTYVNSVGGVELYNHQNFESRSLKLEFLKPRLSPYSQAGLKFFPALSIVDVLMFNSLSAVKNMLFDYEICQNV